MPYVGIGSLERRSVLCGGRMVKACIVLLGAVLVALLILALGHTQYEHPLVVPKVATLQDVRESSSEMLMNAIEGEKIKDNLKMLTKEPHLAGTKSNEKVAKMIEKLFRQAGLQRVHTATYEVLLSQPNIPSSLEIKDQWGRTVYKTKGITASDDQTEQQAAHEWLAYSPEGRVSGDIVFCHYGKKKDFENLKKMGVDLRGRIALLRSGEISLGDKVMEAQRQGAIGVVVYSDPADVARGDTVYPDSVWMPLQGVQRGSINKLNGDPLTPLYPSKPGVFKSQSVDSARSKEILPSIPVLPISYTAAYQIISRMEGRPVPFAWQGLLNVTYRVGPGMKDNGKVTIDVKATFETRHIHNVIGYIPGVDEEDRYVILGKIRNHFDAWVYGSMDPNSGTAILAEVARAMVETMKNSTWKPARSLMFVAWDGGSYGSMGSTEFVEEFAAQLVTRAVAYLNVEAIHGNHSLHVSSVPSLHNILMESAKRIPNPIQEQVYLGRKTLYDSWLKTFPNKKALGHAPLIPIPGGESDHVAFLTFAGIPVVDISFKNHTHHGTFPLQNTIYDTVQLSELYDSEGFSIHRSLAQYWAELARSLSDSPVLPLNVSVLAEEINDNYVVDVRKELFTLPSSQNLIEAKQQFILLEKAAQKLQNAAGVFTHHARNVRDELQFNPFDQRDLRGVNERIMMTERCFVDSRGSQQQHRHILYSVSPGKSYTGRIFGAVYDAIEEYSISRDKAKSGRAIAQQISVVYHAVNCAMASLRHFL